MPLTLAGARWTPSAPDGVVARARAASLKLVPSRLGPFAINVALVPQLEDVELRFEDAEGRRTSVRSKRATFADGQLELSGKVLVEGPEGRELRAPRLLWEEGSDRLRAPGAAAVSVAGGGFRTRPRIATDVWITPSGTEFPGGKDPAR